MLMFSSCVLLRRRFTAVLLRSATHTVHSSCVLRHHESSCVAREATRHCHHRNNRDNPNCQQHLLCLAPFGTSSPRTHDSPDACQNLGGLLFATCCIRVPGTRYMKTRTNEHQVFACHSSPRCLQVCTQQHQALVMERQV